MLELLLHGEPGLSKSDYISGLKISNIPQYFYFLYSLIVKWDYSNNKRSIFRAENGCVSCLHAIVVRTDLKEQGK